MTSYCLGFAFYRSRRKVVLIRKTKPDWQRGKLNGVGGKIEDGEYSNVAMGREFEEETGCPSFCTQWQLFTTLQFPDDVVVYCFAAALLGHQDV
jgi:8-oxo-dGTP diphosphatase